MHIITEPPARKAILRNKAKCFVCLISSHRVVDCDSKVACFKCKQLHHISICKGNVSSNNGSFQNQTRAPQGTPTPTPSLVNISTNVSLKVQSRKLHNSKYIIASTQITNTEIFAFVAVLVFKLFSRRGLFINRKDNKNC